MTKSKPSVYVHRFSGDIKILTKSKAKHLGEDWSKAEQIVNDEGERGMRLQFNGATVDILENKNPKVAIDGDPSTK